MSVPIIHYKFRPFLRRLNPKIFYNKSLFIPEIIRDFKGVYYGTFPVNSGYPPCHFFRLFFYIGEIKSFSEIFIGAAFFQTNPLYLYVTPMIQYQIRPPFFLQKIPKSSMTVSKGSVCSIS